MAAWGIGNILAHSVSPLLYKKIIDLTTSSPTPEIVVELSEAIILIGLIVIAYNLLFRIGDFTHTYAQSNVLKKMSDETFARIGSHSQEFFSNTFVGSLVAKAKRYVDSFENLHDLFVFNVWMNGITFIATVTILSFVAPLLAFVFLGWLVFYVIGTVWFLKRKTPKDIAHTAAQSETTGVLADTITNVLTVKMFASFSREKKGFAKVTQDQETKRRITWNWDNWRRIFQGAAVGIFEVAAMGVAIAMWVRGDITAGTIVLVQIYLFQLIDIAWNLGRQIARIIQSLNDAREMIEIFQEPLSVKDPINPDLSLISDGNIEFDKVTFKYAGSKKVFSNLSLNIPAGQRVGLVGPSGAGKTTITKLILRFADVDSGEIRIDGQDISTIEQDDLRESISYVPQDPILFHRSLRENIAYGKPGASEKEIIRAAKRAHAHEFISKLEDGYNTPVGERGVKLSGGERQRVAIARALLKDAPILILDEATSSLDSISERYIQDALNELMKGRTTLVIAHRLSTVQGMDRILVFKNGKVIEDGTHAELSEDKGGVYRELWEEQSSGFIGE